MASRSSSTTTITLTFLLFFSTATSSSSSSSSVSSSDKVSLALYYESLCPYSARFIVNYLNDVVQDPELLSVVDLYLSPWGNAKLRGNGTFVCQHGPYECLLNTIEACAIHAWPRLKDHFPFIYCVEKLVYERKYTEWATCFDILELDAKPVTDCYANGYGKELELGYASETDALQPPHKYVPWVVVDGKPLYEDYENFVSYICKAYKGTAPVKACSKLSHYTIQKGIAKGSAPVCHKEATVSEQIRSAASL